MKVKELIKELLKCNPETEVVVGSKPLWVVEELPGYYDGGYEVLIENESKKPFYAIEGMKFSKAGNKVRLRIMEIEDVIWNCESEEEINNLKWEYESLHPAEIKMYQDEISEKIKEFKKENI